MTPIDFLHQHYDAGALKPSLARLLEQLHQTRQERDTARKALADTSKRLEYHRNRIDRLQAQLHMLVTWRRLPKRNSKVSVGQIVLPLELSS